MATGETLELALSQLESTVEALHKRVATITAGIKVLQAAAKVGNLRELRRLLVQVEGSCSDLGEAARQGLRQWNFDEEAYFSGEQLLLEVAAEAQRAGVNAFKRDDRLYSYPVVARVLARERTMLIGKVRTKGVRPSYVVSQLRALQKRPVQFKSAAFLDLLVRRYTQSVASRGRTLGDRTVIPLLELYADLTPMPGQEKEYSLQDFARDISILDQSGDRRTKDGKHEVYLPASTGTKTSKTLTVVLESGEECTYYGISFRPIGE